jgi:hypothetical protein
VKRLGLIGLGAIGAPMARNPAAAGLELAVFHVDERRTRADAHDLGARGGLDGLRRRRARGHGPGRAQAQTALLGDDGAAAALPAQAAVIGPGNHGRPAGGRRARDDEDERGGDDPALATASSSVTPAPPAARTQ